MSDPYIVRGYNGIMDLDLTHIPQQYHADMVRLHLQDITDYKIEQQMRPERMRYENTVVKAEQMLEISNDALKKRKREQERRWLIEHGYIVDNKLS